MGKRPVKQHNEMIRDSPTNTLERNKTSLTDFQVSLFLNTALSVITTGCYIHGITMVTCSQVGERVVVNSNVGTIRFTGVTKFAPGYVLATILPWTVAIVTFALL